jgi:hypothetical protein
MMFLIKISGGKFRIFNLISRMRSKALVKAGSVPIYYVSVKAAQSGAGF